MPFLSSSRPARSSGQGLLHAYSARLALRLLSRLRGCSDPLDTYDAAAQRIRRVQRRICRLDQADSRAVLEGEPAAFACIYERTGTLSPAGAASDDTRTMLLE